MAKQNMKDKIQAISLLEEQLKGVAPLKNKRRDSPDFDKWWQKTKTIIANLFGAPSDQLKEFTSISYSLMAFSSSTPDSAFHRAYLSGLETAEAYLEAKIHEIKEFWVDITPAPKGDTLIILEQIFTRFHSAARQLRVRHASRPTLTITDEYDVQDLLHVFLKLHFDDIRAEEWTPSYAGGSARVDFLLKSERVVVEVKRTRATLGEKEVGDQLLIDRQRYQAHPDCKSLYCFVYDPEAIIGNPVGLESDLKSDTPLPTRVFIFPK